MVVRINAGAWKWMDEMVTREILVVAFTSVFHLS